MGTDEAFSLPRSLLSLLSFGGLGIHLIEEELGGEVIKGEVPQGALSRTRHLGGLPPLLNVGWKGTSRRIDSSSQG